MKNMWVNMRFFSSLFNLSKIKIMYCVGFIIYVGVNSMLIIAHRMEGVHGSILL